MVTVGQTERLVLFEETKRRKVNYIIMYVRVLFSSRSCKHHRRHHPMYVVLLLAIKDSSTTKRIGNAVGAG